MSTTNDTYVANSDKYEPDLPETGKYSVSVTCLLLMVAAAIYLIQLLSRKIIKRKQEARNGSTEGAVLMYAPGPIPFPLIGSLHLLGAEESPFQSFTGLAKIYGDIFSIQLGSTACIVVNNLELIREVLNQNGKLISGRPDFIRFHKLFAGDRNNSLALCDWSNLQLRRRKLARAHCGPRQHTDNFAQIGVVATFEAVELINILKHVTSTTNGAIKLKPYLMSSALNMFTHYMCNVRFDAEKDTAFRKIVDLFDEIFWEINQGYAVDFMPWLLPFYKKHMDKLSTWSQEIRSFILTRIVEQREASLDTKQPEKDFLDGLLRVLEDDPSVDRNTVIFMLEDFLGGHSSIGNLVMLCFAAIIREPEVGKLIREEIFSVTKGMRPVSLLDRPNLPYTEATIMECLRYSSSPIVPHVAMEPATVAGYTVQKGTVVFINNYELNTSTKYWNEPGKFDPSRFLEHKMYRQHKSSVSDSGLDSETEMEKEIITVRKNIPHFLPFSIGKRTCIGQTLVTTMSFVMLANIMQEFDLYAENLDDLRQKPACVALPKETFGITLVPRCK